MSSTPCPQHAAINPGSDGTASPYCIACMKLNPRPVVRATLRPSTIGGFLACPVGGDPTLDGFWSLDAGWAWRRLERALEKDGKLLAPADDETRALIAGGAL